MFKYMGCKVLTCRCLKSTNTACLRFDFQVHRVCVILQEPFLLIRCHANITDVHCSMNPLEWVREDFRASWSV